MDALLTLTHATERDVDLLLVEELTASSEFAHWLGQRAGWTESVGQWGVTHSKRRTQNRREIDIELRLTSPAAKRAILLIENKLGESPQSNQAESYREECQLLIRNGACSLAANVLVCPPTL